MVAVETANHETANHIAPCRRPRAATPTVRDDGDEARARARDEACSRDRNESIAGAHESLDTTVPAAYVCECGDADYVRTIDLSAGEYESVQASSTRLAVAVNHENPDPESVVSECARRAVSAAIADESLRIARDSVPRSAMHGRSRGA